MLIFVVCIDVIITLILLFITEIIIPINVILMMIINACNRFDQWFTHCLSITLQREINYSLKKKRKKKKKRRDRVVSMYAIVLFSGAVLVHRALTVCVPTRINSPSRQSCN